MKTVILLGMIFCFNISILGQNLFFESSLPDQIIAGEVHYSRIPVQYWQHRIMMIKAMGMNTLSVYVMWNHHQLSRGHFDYDTGNKNLPIFLQLASKHQMYVLFRPGPYVCAEWDFGGMPSRLLNIEGLIIRANNQQFLLETRIYFESLVPIFKPFLKQNGGPIILLQIQNQYGSYGIDKSYIEALRNIWKSLQISCQEYYVDAAENIRISHWYGANIGINGAVEQQQYDYARALYREGKHFGGQIYSGWLTHWGEQWQQKTLEKFLKEFGFLFQHKHSFSMYMIHGGTNFGLTAGANSLEEKSDYTADVTSYDYDAPINQQGSPNEKYFKFRELAKNYVSWNIPEPPDSLPTIQIPAFTPVITADLFSNLPEPTIKNFDIPLHFESEILQMWSQGFVMYETTLCQERYKICTQIHDFGLVFLDGKYFKTLNRCQQKQHQFYIDCFQDQCTLRILIEAMGHLNYANQMQNDKKGLISFQDTFGTKFKWSIYRIPVDTKMLQWKAQSEQLVVPIMSKMTINLSQLGDTYLNMSKYKKGYVWVNGILLGRYWNIGPQQKLFCPGIWLKKGNNQITVLQLLDANTYSITGDKTLK